MKKNRRKITGPEAERALFHTLKDEGLLPPESEEDIAALEDELGVFPEGSSDVPDLPLLWRDGLVEPASADGEVEGQIERSLAQAARRGGKIPPEILKLMERDREQSEREHDAP